MTLVVENKHQSWLRFIQKVAAVPQDFSMEELKAFRRVATKEAPSFVPIIEAYLHLSSQSETTLSNPSRASKRGKRKPNGEMHLFDLLREKRIFPQNLQLAQFAGRVLPHMRNFRFDKMSRSDIAARIIEYIERSDDRTRSKLEDSMREALGQMQDRPANRIDRTSFFSKWERIIKGLEL